MRAARITVSSSQAVFIASAAPAPATRLADRGLAGLTKDLQVGLQTALFDFDAADTSTRPKTVTALRVAIDQLRRFLSKNPALPLPENNPFGITVTIRTTASVSDRRGRGWLHKDFLAAPL
jgi:hypothetical protein